MSNKDKISNMTTKTTTPVEKELSADVLTNHLESMSEYHNKLVEKEKELTEELAKVRTARVQSAGGINTMQNLHDEYFVKSSPSINGDK